MDGQDLARLRTSAREKGHYQSRSTYPHPERACEPLDLDSWQWADDGHGRDELNAVFSEYAHQAEPPTPRAGLSPREVYTLRRIQQGRVLQMTRLLDAAEPEAEQLAFASRPAARPAVEQPRTPLEWAHIRWERKRYRQRRLVRRTGPPVMLSPAPYRPRLVLEDRDLPDFLTGVAGAPDDASRSQAKPTMGPQLAFWSSTAVGAAPAPDGVSKARPAWGIAPEGAVPSKTNDPASESRPTLTDAWSLIARLKALRDERESAEEAR